MAKSKAKVLTMRMDESLDKKITEMAKLRGMSRSELVRDSLERTLKEDEIYKVTVYERLKPWIGIFDSSKHPDGPFDAKDASKQFGDMVWEKWQRRSAKRPR